MTQRARLFILSALMVCSALLSTGTALADPNYPQKPIRVVISSAPGGPLDAASRALFQKAAARLGPNTTLIFDNKPGANLQIAGQFVARAAPDGYTVLTTALGHLTNPLLNKSMAYDPIKDLQGVALMSRVQNIMAVHADVPARTVQELIAWGKANPDKFQFASSGNGSGAHLIGELFSMHAGVKMQHIAYKGTAAALPDLLTGRVPIMIDTLQLLGPHIESGKLRAIALTGDRRSAAMPQVGTMIEAGLSGVNANSWLAVVAPRDTPRAIIERLSKALNEALQDDEIKRQWQSFGMVADTMTPAQVEQFFAQETALWDRVIKTNNIRLE